MTHQLVTQKFHQVKQRAIRKINPNSNVYTRRLFYFSLNLFSRQFLNASFSHGSPPQFYDQNRTVTQPSQAITLSSKKLKPSDICMGCGEQGHWIKGSQRPLKRTKG